VVSGAIFHVAFLAFFNLIIRIWHKASN
jgi:hypothetical protein